MSTLAVEAILDNDGYTVDHQPVRRFVVLNDAPVGDGGNDDDLLAATEVASGLADLIVESRAAAPFTLAVDAPWGMGKSSLMNRLETTLSAEPAVSVVWFNAWTSGQASALEGLIKSVLLRFDRNIIRRAVRSMSQRAHLLGALRSVGLLLGSFFGLGRVVDEMWRKMSLNAQARNEIKGVLRDAFTTWLDRSSSPDGRRLLVVFIDDLDRCANERIIEVCEAIKLYLDVPGIVFVLACDQSALWQAVRESEGMGDPASTVEYLEKIIQINYRIPVPGPAHALKLVNGYLARSRTSQLFDESMKNLIIERSGRNPRRIKRLINSFVLEYHLNRAWDEVGVEHLVKVVMLQHFYPGFYRLLVNPRHDDPITEFVGYHEFRSAVKQGESLSQDKLTELFRARDTRPPRMGDTAEKALAELEKELPREFPKLAADRDFVALVEGFAGPGFDTRRVRQLLRRPLSTTDRSDKDFGLATFHRRRVPVSHETEETAPAGDLGGLRILWIDDKPGSNHAVTDILTRRGAVVVPVTNIADATREIQQRPPDLLLTDFGRDDEPDAGLQDLEYLRARGLYRGPALFCSGRGTAAMRDLVRELDADGPTNDENEIVRWVERAAER